ncbi:hypothetical protein LRS74_23155 [Streptomyces sp. LX-29]|uniref:SCO2584 family spore wall biosynthesis protein n=1 Tax=Streptomyces sp. LX-29 TaxID=2900152 RepID=UPI00240E1A73|nr:hypothetical protein [Streptomyces sp. LX-29]WFB09621.1 hypothetical protein LRS74_23155 [Streptomyces sp. LX-29]
MPDDVGGRPFPDGDEPDERSHGDAEDAFATVIFDEDFVRSAEIHEPTAVERMLAAAQARAEAEASRRRSRGGPSDDDLYDEGYGPDGDFGYDPDDERGVDDRFGPGRGADGDEDDAFGPYGRYGSAGRPYHGHARWHRPVAWLLAVLMGIGVVALAFAAVYRGASSGRQDPVAPPTSTGVDSPSGDRSGALPSVSASTGAPPASAVQRSP